MLVVTRHRLPLPGFDGDAAALAAARDLLATLADRPGFMRGWVGRSTDEPDLLLVGHEWSDVGSGRRAMGSVEVRMRQQFLQTAEDEASTFEVLTLHDGALAADRPSARAADADVVGQGEGAPHVDTGAFG